MSHPAVKERITRLEESGVITQYTTQFNLESLGRGVMSFLLIKTEQCQELIDFCKKSALVTDLFRISGEYNYLLQLRTSDVEELADFQDALAKLGPSKLHIGLKSIMENRIVI